MVYLTKPYSGFTEVKFRTTTDLTPQIASKRLDRYPLRSASVYPPLPRLMERLRARICRFFTSRAPPSSKTSLQASVVPFSAAVATASMVAYSSAVSKLEAAADVPEEARRATHHVKGSDGTTIKFRNPHPSAGGPPSAWETGRKILW